MPKTDTGTHGHEAPGSWEFDASVAAAFDEMLARSIPDYEAMRGYVADLASTYLKRLAPTANLQQRPLDVVDLGASRGEMVARIQERHGTGADARWVLVESADAMLDALAERFPLADANPKFGDGGWGKTIIARHPTLERGWDLRLGYPGGISAAVTLSVLTLQFTPIEYRQRIVRDVFRATRPGGCFLLVEKVLGETGEIDELLVERYLVLKRAHGYSEEEVTRKRAALEGVLVPVTARWNAELLRGAGFQHVDCFWRHLNFAGWIAVKEPGL